jgi:hypothetical protein
LLACLRLPPMPRLKSTLLLFAENHYHGRKFVRCVLVVP